MQGKMSVHNLKYTTYYLYLHIKETFKQITSLRRRAVKVLDVQVILPVLETCIQRTSHPTKAKMLLAY